ncbi:TIGR01440 family protein [Metallumcola ferriviriculae]|uniref:UPF0340 protein MFMK1_000612 n=1 Tax=Metallumcola ferriviriculae TaxID=3039180 RepID=A0AAU0UKB0_9FIRM|nr:TIGR01440 family protein [Desulfitibacteraceae bacterium MK1]
MELKDISISTKAAVEFLIDQAQPEAGMVLVVGCSTSEVMGKKIGSASNEEAARTIYQAIAEACDQQVALAFQCCEHLNRALVVEKETAMRLGLTVVSAVPKLGAGGALSAQAFREFLQPVLVEHIAAQLGMDIGDTFIGMHLQPVLKPVRAKVTKIGSANLTMGYSRPKLIGGERAVYCD